MPARDVFLHVGLTKTGTSYLQVRLRSALDELERQGVTLVPRSQFDAHLLSLVVRDAYDPEVDRRRGADALERLPEQLAAADAERILISAETLAGGDEKRVATLGNALGDHRVHLVLTVRDLARSIPSVWQQTVRSGRSMEFGTFVDRVVRGPGKGGPFWRGHDVLGVLQRWGSLAPPERCHVVVVPPSDAPREQLLERFCSVLGVDATRLPPPPDLRGNQSNESLGMVQTEVLRRVNALLPDTARRRDVHRHVVKKPFAFGVLGAQDGKAARMPRRYAEWCREHTAELQAALRDGGYQVVGDPDDLVSPDRAFGDDDVDVDPAAVADAAVAAIAGLLTQRADEYVAAKEAARQERGAAQRGRRRPAPDQGSA